VRRRLTPPLLAALTALGLAACGGSSPQPMLPARHAPELESIFEPAGQLFQAPAQTLGTLRALGVQRVRVDLVWDQIAPDPDASAPPAGFEPADPASYPPSGWSAYDTVFRDARARGLQLDVTVTGPAPRWAEAPGEPPGGFPGVWKPDAAAFGAFVAAVGRRYSGHYLPPGAPSPLPRVDFWSIWNEPNNGFDLAPQAIEHNLVAVSPRTYRGLLDEAWRALQRTGHGHDTILIGETAPRGQVTGGRPGNFSVMEPLRFIRALYCLSGAYRPLRGTLARAIGCPATAEAARFRAQNPALFDASGYADHPYPQGPAPPDERTPSSVVPGAGDYADFAALPALAQTLDRVLAAYGSHRRLSIWSTEFGYHTDPPEPAMTPPGLAARYLNWAEFLSWINPRVRSFDQYLLADAAGNRFATGLELPDGARLATFYAFRMPLFLPRTRQAPGGRLLVWGCVRPAWYAGTGQLALLQFAAGDSGAYRTIRRVRIPDRAGYFELFERFPRSGRLRVAWRYPRGVEIHSRVVRISVG
jgi:hypothetical protein